MERKCVEAVPGKTGSNRAFRHKAAFVIITDLDGTLLDARNYSFNDAREGLEAVRRGNIPCILCSSKTRAEIEKLRAKMMINDPFISENGGGIFIPSGYFPANIEEKFPAIEGNFFIIRLGADYSDLRTTIREARSEGFDVNGFGDMSLQEIAKSTGLSERDARLAARRDFDEPFFFRGSDEDREHLIKWVQSKGLSIARASGIFHHLIGKSDKGKAVAIVIDLYRKENDGIITLGLGDASNDLPMLREVDIPVIVKKPDGSYDSTLAAENFYKAGGIGPKGWNQVILKIIKDSRSVLRDKSNLNQVLSVLNSS